MLKTVKIMKAEIFFSAKSERAFEIKSSSQMQRAVKSRGFVKIIKAVAFSAEVNPEYGMKTA